MGKDFDKSINKHLKFLKDNLENQNKYSSKFSEILQELDIFQTMMKISFEIKKIMMMVKIIPPMKS